MSSWLLPTVLLSEGDLFSSGLCSRLAVGPNYKLMFDADAVTLLW